MKYVLGKDAILLIHSIEAHQKIQVFQVVVIIIGVSSITFFMRMFKMRRVATGGQLSCIGFAGMVELAIFLLTVAITRN